MPSAEVILAAATRIANDWQALAIVWHVLLASLIVALSIGWRPANAVLGYLLIVPLGSVSLIAWLSGVPFNGFLFAVLAIVLAIAAHRFPTRRIALARSAWSAPGALLVAFGWIYPHFVATDRWTTYLYAAPFGLLPCPTLSVIIGLTLALAMYRFRAWSVAVIGAGAVYGVIGVFRLGVALDYGLLAGTALLLAATGDIDDFVRLRLVRSHAQREAARHVRA